MYRELQPFREVLRHALTASLLPAAVRLEPKVLGTWLDRLITHTGVDLAD